MAGAADDAPPADPRSSEPADEVLAGRVQQGDRDALERLAGRYLRPVHAVTASYLADQADIEDAVQETFLRTLNHIAAYDPTRAFAPWLYQIARNVARDHAAAIARRPARLLAVEEPATAAPGPDVAMERAEIHDIVASAIGDLPEQQRTAFRLHDVDGYTTHEIARIMGLATGTIRSHVHHARRTLRAALANRLREPTKTGE
jgi:RNA polymerase sigma-70 factor, ECF subfamily